MKKPSLLFVATIFLTCLCDVARADNAATELAVFADGRVGIALEPEVLDALPALTDANPAGRHADPELQSAVVEFKAIFEQMTGLPVPMKPGGGALPLTLSIDAELQLPYHGCRVVTDAASGVQLIAPSRRGLINGIYTLLDDWGCRWVLPGEIGQVIPRVDSLVLPIGTRDFVPAFEMSMHYNFRGDDSRAIRAWLIRNRAAEDHWLSGQHYWSYAIDPKQYFAEHPEYFALVGDQRTADQLCTTHPRVIELMVAAAKEYLARHTTAVTFPIDPNDNFNLCQCDNCSALDPPGLEFGQPLVTDRVLHFANAVAEAIESEFPDRGVAFYAYLNHTQPPVHTRPHRNVHIILTRANYCLLHLVPTESCADSPQSPAAFEQLIADWAALAQHVYVYEYNPIAWTGDLPCPLHIEFARTIQRQHELGVRGRQVDGAYPQSGSNFLSHYMVLRFLVDPTLDPEAELASICQALFGPAGEAMQRFYATTARVTEQAHTGRDAVGFGIERYEQLFTPQMIAEARSAIDEAASLSAPGSIQRQRVDMVGQCQQYLEAYLDGIWSAQAGRYDESVAAFDRVDAMIEQLAAAGYMQNVEDTKRRLTTARLKALAQNFPDRLGMRRSWFVLGPFENNDMAAINETLDWETRPRLAPSKPLHVEGQTAKWDRVTSPTGFFSFESAFEDAAADGGMSYAYALLPLRVKQDTPAEFRVDSFHGFRIFLNGQQVFERLGINADAPDRYVVPVTLPAGDNTILIKVGQAAIGSSSPWGFYFRITDRSGQPFGGD